MASSGDPSSFTFTIDAFPDYTRFDKTKKVLAAIQIIDVTREDQMITRRHTRPTVQETEAAEAKRDMTWTKYEPQD